MAAMISSTPESCRPRWDRPAGQAEVSLGLTPAVRSRPVVELAPLLTLALAVRAAAMRRADAAQQATQQPPDPLVYAPRSLAIDSTIPMGKPRLTYFDFAGSRGE
jgi:hypothetical protein